MGKSDKKRILLKIGSNVLTEGTNQISIDKINDIANQIISLQDKFDFVIVSSGAIATAKQFVCLDGKAVHVKQALAAIGQPRLMRMYQDVFQDKGLLTSQCLLSYYDFEKEQSKINIKNAIDVLVENGYIPIINENDTVATDEIKFGDNDKLAAMTASLIGVDLFIIATNTSGIYKKESINNECKETIKVALDVNELRNEIEETISLHGTGGMTTKVEAAKIAQKANIETWIVNGLNENFIVNAINNVVDFTKIKTKLNETLL